MYVIELNNVEFVVSSNGWMPKWVRPFLSEDPSVCFYDWVNWEDRASLATLPKAKNRQDLLDLKAIRP